MLCTQWSLFSTTFLWLFLLWSLQIREVQYTSIRKDAIDKKIGESLLQYPSRFCSGVGGYLYL